MVSFLSHTHINTQQIEVPVYFNIHEYVLERLFYFPHLAVPVFLERSSCTVK